MIALGLDLYPYKIYWQYYGQWLYGDFTLILNDYIGPRFFKE